MEGSLIEAANIMNGTLHGTDRNFAGVSTDTRTLGPGELFFALAGPNYDGSEFVSKAAETNPLRSHMPSAKRLTTISC